MCRTEVYGVSNVWSEQYVEYGLEMGKEAWT